MLNIREKGPLKGYADGKVVAKVARKVAWMVLPVG